MYDYIYKKSEVVWTIVPPIMYVIYAGIGYINNWEFLDGLNYPYFFLNWGCSMGPIGFSNEFPFMGTVWWILILLFILFIGFLYRFISNSIIHKK